MDVNLNDFRVPIASRIHIWWQWLWDRKRVGYLCGLDSGIFLWLKVFGGSWEHKSSEITRPCAWTWIWAVFGCLLLHEYTYDGSGCETESVWGTCVDLIPAYFYDWRSLAEVESIKAVKFRDLVYKCEFLTVFGSLCLHKYLYDGSGCETEYVWGTCVDLIPSYFYDWRSLAEVESIKVVQNRSITVKSIVC